MPMRNKVSRKDRRRTDEAERIVIRWDKEERRGQVNVSFIIQSRRRRSLLEAGRREGMMMIVTGNKSAEFCVIWNRGRKMTDNNAKRSDFMKRLISSNEGRSIGYISINYAHIRANESSPYTVIIIKEIPKIDKAHLPP